MTQLTTVPAVNQASCMGVVYKQGSVNGITGAFNIIDSTDWGPFILFPSHTYRLRGYVPAVNSSAASVATASIRMDSFNPINFQFAQVDMRCPPAPLTGGGALFESGNLMTGLDGVYDFFLQVEQITGPAVDVPASPTQPAWMELWDLGIIT